MFSKLRMIISILVISFVFIGCSYPYKSFNLEPKNKYENSINFNDFNFKHTQITSLSKYNKYTNPKTANDRWMIMFCDDYEHSAMKPKECWNYYDPSRETRNLINSKNNKKRQSFLMKYKIYNSWRD